MEQYKHFEVDEDFINHRPHLFYLCRRIILKNVSNYILPEHILKEFVSIAKFRYGNKEADDGTN